MNKIKNYINTLKNKIDFLESHNKNYTKQQYYTILDLQEIIENLEKEMEV